MELWIQSLASMLEDPLGWVPDTVAHVCNPKTLQTQAEGLEIQGHSRLHITRMRHTTKQKP